MVPTLLWDCSFLLFLRGSASVQYQSVLFFETVSAGRCKHLEAERRDLIHLDCNTKHVEGRLLVKHV